MKKFTAVFLLLVFLCNSVGIFGLFLILKRANYESVCNNTDRLNLTHLIIPKTKKIRWEKDNEIIYEGKYYDVFSKSEDARNTYLTCYSDSKDERLAQTWHKHLDESYSDSSKKTPDPTTLKITFEDFLLPTVAWNIMHPVAGKVSEPACLNIYSGFIPVFTPPPDFMV